MYKIKGNPVSDFVAVVFCPFCTIARCEREIRVREGDNKMRARLKYTTEKSQGGFNVAAAQPIQIPPPRTEPMRYVSPRETSEHTSNHSNFDPPSYVQDPHGPHDFRNAEPQRPLLAFLKPQKHQKHRKDAGANPQVENKVDTTIDAMGDLHAANQGSNSEGRITHSANSQMEHPVENPGLPTSDFTIENEGIDLPTEPYGSVAKRAGFSSDSTDVPGTVTTENTLTDSEARDIATSLRGKRSNIGGTGGQELSYVHDFTDCPVSKSVLMYYENEGNKSRKPSSQEETGSGLSSNNPYQHLLGGCQNNPTGNGKDLTTNELTEFSDISLSLQELMKEYKRTSSFDKESGHNQGDSNRPPATRSAEEFAPDPLSCKTAPRADKKATSF